MAILAVSCTQKSTTDPVILPLRENGIFVLNQGNFTYANASFSYYNPDDKSVKQNVFYETNGVPLGDVAQSITIEGDTAYLIINNSGFIYAINRHNGEFIGKITGFESPRQMIFVNPNKAYVSDLYAHEISVISPLTNEMVKRIPLGRSSESMVLANNQVFIANWSDYNQSDNNNVISVIDAESDQLIDTIHVGKEPNSMVVDINGNIWVLCSGGYMNDEIPTLWKIDPVSRQVLHTARFPEIISNPTYLTIDRLHHELLFLNEGIYKMGIQDTTIPTQAFIPQGELNFYALYAVPSTGEIYVSDAGNYLSNGWVYRYNPEGTEIDRFEAGIIPGAFRIND